MILGKMIKVKLKLTSDLTNDVANGELSVVNNNWIFIFLYNKKSSTMNESSAFKLKKVEP